jgi:uncharacterized protein
MKRVFIIHGWGGTPDLNWIPWLGNELAKKKFDVHALLMPNTEDPNMGEWVSYLTLQIGAPDADTYLVGHSLGCQTIMRYLESLKPKERIGGAVLVAGFFTIKEEAMEDADTSRVLGPWIDIKIDLKQAKSHCARIVSIMSDNDPYIPLEDSKQFENGLGAQVIVIPSAGHFTIDLGGYKELHVALNELLKIVK